MERKQPSDKNLKYTEDFILKNLNNKFLSSPKYIMNNLYVFSWESDYLALTRSGLFYEVEVKISRSDFFNDKKNKNQKLLLLENKIDYNKNNIPNYFYYAVPTDMISVEETPEYAGLIYVNEYGSLRTIKNAPKINENKIDIGDLNLTDKFYYNMVSWRNKAKGGYQKTIEQLRETIRLSKKDEDGNSYKFTLGEAKRLISALEEELATKEKLLNDLYEKQSEYRNKYIN